MYVFKENKITPYDINSDKKYITNPGYFTLDAINRYNNLVSSRFNKSISHNEFMNDIDKFKSCLSHNEFVKIKKSSCDLKYREEHSDRIRINFKRYSENNKNKLKEYKHDYYISHKEETLLRHKKYCETHRNTIREYKKSYRLLNKDHIAEYRVKNRDTINASKRQNHRRRMDKLIYSDRFKGICAICRCKVNIDDVDRYPEFHHIRYKNKRYNISDLVVGYKSADLINEEIELGKVILVCHKCHLKESAWQGRLEKRSVTEKEVLEFVKLRDECGMSYHDISEKYGLSVDVVRNAVINYHDYHDSDTESKMKADLLVYY